MNYGYFSNQPMQMQAPNMAQFGYGAQMPPPSAYSTPADVMAQRDRLKTLGLDDTAIDDLLKFKQGLLEKRDEMQTDVLKSAGAGIKSLGSSAKSGLASLGSSL